MFPFRQPRDSIYCPSSGYDGIGTTAVIDCFKSHFSILIWPHDCSCLVACGRLKSELMYRSQNTSSLQAIRQKEKEAVFMKQSALERVLEDASKRTYS